MNAGARVRSFGTSILIGATVIAVGAGGAEAAPKKKPAFKVTAVSNPPATAGYNDVFDVTGTVVNRGKKAGEPQVTVSLNDENEPKGGAFQMGTVTLDRVRPKQTADYDVEAMVPSDIPTGTYYLVACAKPKKGSGCKVADTPIVVTETVFSPGARSADDDLYPQTGNGGYDAVDYDIELNYDPVANTFGSGTRTTMTADTTQNLSEFTMDFQDIGVTAVEIDGQPVDSFQTVAAQPPVSSDPDVTELQKLVIDPAGAGILEDQRIAVVVEYAGEPALITDPDFSSEGWVPACYTDESENEVCDGGFTVNEPNGAQGWFPSNNFPTDKATFSTSITVPEGYESAGMGELESNPVNGDGTETWNWVEDDPTSTYLTTATTGQFEVTTPTIFEQLTGLNIPQYNFVDSSANSTEAASIATSLGRTQEMTNFLSNRFGPYPYDSNGAVVDNVEDVCYALENATKSHFAASCPAPPNQPTLGVGQSTLLHEISHQWMGNAVTLENWDDIWFQEGWAQWSSWSWNFEDGTSPNSPGAQWSANYASGPASKWDTIPTELNDNPEDLFATFPTYTRGAMTYQGYREIVGSPKFFEFARELQSRYAYDNVSSEDVVDLMLEVSDFEGDRLTLLENYFDQWLYQAGKPTITPNDFT